MYLKHGCTYINFERGSTYISLVLEKEIVLLERLIILLFSVTQLCEQRHEKKTITSQQRNNIFRTKKIHTLLDVVHPSQFQMPKISIIQVKGAEKTPHKTQLRLRAKVEQASLRLLACRRRYPHTIDCEKKKGL